MSVGAMEIYSPQEVQIMASQAAASKLFPGINTEQAAFTLMMLCQSEGMPAIQALKRYHIIEGRPSMRADAMQAEFQRQGGVVKWVTSNDEECVARFVHPVQAPEPGFEIGVTLRSLVDSGVATSWDKESNSFKLKKVYRQFPAQMLRARAISQGVRAVLPGVVAGIYTPEEVQDFQPEARARARHVEVEVVATAPARDADRGDAIGVERLEPEERSEAKPAPIVGRVRDEFDEPATPRPAPEKSKTIEEYLGKARDFRDFQDRAIKALRRVNPDRDETATAMALINRVITDAVEAGANGHIKFQFRHVLKDQPNDNGVWVRDPSKAAREFNRLYDDEQSWTVGTVSYYIEEKRDEAADAVAHAAQN